MQRQNALRQAAVEQTMAANTKAMSAQPTTIRRKKRPSRGSGRRGMDRLRIALQEEQGTSTNLG
jgi:hypothetical protein